MPPIAETADDPLPDFSKPPREPGLVLVWTAGAPTCRKYPLPPSARALKLGRRDSDITLPDDARVSASHASLTVEGDELVIRDLGSSNGVYIDGVRMPAKGAPGRVSLTPHARRHVLRFGGSVFLVEPDLARLDSRTDLRVRDPLLGDAIAGAATHNAWAEAILAARLGQPLLIHGESGSGKQRVAEIYRARGTRPKGELVEFNCATVERSLADATLFGHARGAFTGADRQSEGLFEKAHGGVLFMDEIGELALDVQAKLLKVVESGKFMRVGGGEVRVDVHLVCATHRDLHAQVAAGLFRHDLLERISMREVDLPPLRDRPEEIPFLVQLLIEKAPKHPDLPDASAASMTPSSEFIDICLREEWPGNVRSLTRVVARAVTAGIKGIDGFDFTAPQVSAVLRGARASAPPPPTALDGAPALAVDPAETAILAAYRDNRGNVTATSKQMGCSRGKIYAVLERAGLKPKDDDA